MPLAPGSLQSATGTAGTTSSGVSSATVTLPNLTVPGSTVLVALAGATAILPDGWVQDQTNANLVFQYRRLQPDGGENSWGFTSSIASLWAWYAEEIAGVDLVDPVDQIAAGTLTASSATVNSGTTGTTSTGDTAIRAVFSVNTASGRTSGETWPAARTYGNGFTELAYVPLSTGAGPGSDVFLAVAQLYPGTTGAFTTTMTLDTTGGGSFNHTTEAGLTVVYRAAGTLPSGPSALTA